MEFANLIAERRHKKIYRDGAQAVKLFEAGYPKSDVLNEALNQARAEETGLGVPKIQSVGVIGGQWAIAMDYAEGPTMASLIKGENEPLLEEFVDLHLAVHAQKAPLMNVLKYKIERQLNAFDMDGRVRYELLARLSSFSPHYKLLHGDFIPSNVVVSEGDGKPIILDWAHATQGNASADAARTYLLLRVGRQDAIAERYLDLYCRKTGAAKSYVQNWMPVVAAAQLTKGVPEEKEFLSRWINVFDYE